MISSRACEAISSLSQVMGDAAFTGEAISNGTNMGVLYSLGMTIAVTKGVIGFVQLQVVQATACTAVETGWVWTGIVSSIAHITTLAGLPATKLFM